MARRSDHTREELHTMLLDAAMAITRQDGADALTARRLAQAIGYTPGTIYQIFENLDDLVAQLKVRILGMLLARFDDRERSDDAERDIAHLVELYLQFEANEPQLWHALFVAPLPGGAPIPPRLLTAMGEGLARVEDAVRPLFRKGDRVGPARAARTLWAGLHGIVALTRSTALSTAGALDTDAMARDFADTYLAGIRAKQRKRG